MSGKKAQSSRRRFGYLRKLQSGRFQASYIGPDGVRHVAPGTFRTEKDADSWLVVAESGILRGTWRARPAEVLTVGQWSKRWLASVTPHLKRTTVSTYATLLRVSIYPTFEHTELSQIRPIDIGEWIAELSVKRGNSPSWVRKAYRLLSEILKAAVNNDIIRQSPMRGHRLPQLPEATPTILTPEDVERVVAVADPPFDVLFLVLAYSGVRIGELLGLHPADVAEDGSRITISRRHAEVDGAVDVDTPKAHQARTVTLPDFVAEALSAHRADRLEAVGADGPLWVSLRGRPLRYAAFRRNIFDRCIEAAGLVDVTPHDFRASHATWVADQHGVLAAARRLGHSNASVTTRHYARAARGDDVVAAGFERPGPVARG